MNLDKILMKDNVMTQKLTHKERAIQFWSNYNMAVTDRTETLEQAFTQVANEALEEAAKFIIDEQMDHAEVYADAIRSLMERVK